LHGALRSSMFSSTRRVLGYDEEYEEIKEFPDDPLW
jgi:hypothetical protein